MPESRKLELNAFLTRPTTRLARYPLLLETVLKHTPDDSSDKTMIPKVIHDFSKGTIWNVSRDVISFNTRQCHLLDDERR